MWNRKKTLSVLLACVLLLTLSGSVESMVMRIPYLPGSDMSQSAKEQGLDPYMVETEFIATRINNGQQPPLDAYKNALSQWNLLSQEGLSGQGTAAPITSTLTGSVWKSLGPAPMNAGGGRSDNGRVSAIAVHPNNLNVVYMGSSGGGVWKTIDGGVNWTPLTDQEASMGTGEPSSIAIDPNDPNTVYFGTSGRFVLNTSAGILKSTDGGGSWVVMGSGFPADNVGNADDTFARRSINTIIVEPTDSDILYLGASNGLYRSTDGGLNWTQGTNGGGDARSLVLDTSSPANARILYGGISGTGNPPVSGRVLQSTDGGQTWNQILNAATPAVAAALAGGAFSHVRCVPAPPENPPDANGVQVLYVTMTGFNGAPDPLGIFRSTDQGATWNAQSATGLTTSTQGGFNLTLAVDPTSPGDGANDILFFGGVGQFRSTDSGQNFANTANNQHVDTHTWTLVSQNPDPAVIYTGNDGGIWRSVDNGATWTGTGAAPPTINSGSYQGGLFYNMDLKRDATASVTAGSTQDNGTLRTTGSLTWARPQGGDGWDIAFDYVNTSNVYISSGFWSPAPCTRVWKSSDSGASFPSDVTPWPTPSADDGCYLGPVVADPSMADVIYASGDANLWQTTDGGSNWRNIGGFPGTVQISVAKGDSNTVAVADGGRVWVSTDALAAGVNWTEITRDLPNRTVTRVAVDPLDPNVIYAVLSGFDGQTVRPGHVFRTTVGGTVWDDLSPNVDAPVLAIAIDDSAVPPQIFIGTDLGVMRSVDGGNSWATVDDPHLPNVPITDIVINTVAGVLRASSYGRGVFELAAPDGPVIAVSVQNGGDFGTACVADNVYLTLTVYNVGTEDLFINDVSRLFGSDEFTVLPNPPTPVAIFPGEHIDFTVQFNPGSVGSKSASIRIASNDPAAPNYDVMVNGEVAGATIATIIAEDGNFGNVCVGDFRDLNLTINNAGLCDLQVGNITSSSSQFDLADIVNFPLVVGAGDSIAIPIRFQPTSVGSKTGTITVASNDFDNPSVQVAVEGVGAEPDIGTVIVDNGDFGDVCRGDFRDLDLIISNSGNCDLSVSNITTSNSLFDVATVMSYPLVIGPGDSLAVPIRFAPVLATAFGPQSGNITVSSSDPDSPSVVVGVNGNVPPGNIGVTGSTDFGDVCAEELAEKTIQICNFGLCNLDVTSVAFDPPCDDFEIINNPFPNILSHDFCVDLTIRFTPTSAGPKSCNLRIESDDPDTPVINLTVTANTPIPMIDVPPDLGFAPEVIKEIGACESLLQFPVSNTGECNLTITGFSITTNDAEYSLRGLPSFPIILEPGHIVGEGDLRVAFTPEVIDRANSGVLTVEYVSDPITGDTMTTTRDLCGEGVKTGARILVAHNGVPLPKVKQLKLQRVNPHGGFTLARPDKPETIETVRDLILTDVNQTSPCSTFQYHREYGTVSNPVQLLPGEYLVTATVRINNRNLKKTVAFNVGECDFNQNIVIDFVQNIVADSE